MHTPQPVADKPVEDLPGPEKQPVPSLRRNFSWTLVGNIVYAGCQWGMLIAIAKLGTLQMLGTFVLGFALTAPVIMLANLRLRAVQATDAKREYDFQTYWTLRLVTSGMAILAIVVVAFASGCRGEKAAVVLLIGVAKAIESISDVVYGLLQQQERMDRIAISLMVRGPLSLLALGLCLYLTHSILWGVAGLVAAWALSLVLCDIPFGVAALRATKTSDAGRSWTSLLRPQIHADTLVRLTRLALPLGIVTVLASLTVNVPRYFMEAYRGGTELAIFAALASINVAGGTVVNALGHSAQPRLARYYAGGSAQFSRLVVRLTAIGGLVGFLGVLVALVAGRELLTMLFRPEYARSASSFVWIMIAGGIACVTSFLACAITATRAFRRFVVPRIITFLVTLACSAVLIPSHGVTGAAWALCVGNSVYLIALVLILAARRRPHKKSSDYAPFDDGCTNGGAENA